VPVEIAAERETTALGAAALAGLATGLWRDPQEVRSLLRPGAVYEPRLGRDDAEARREEWRRALRRVLA
jgi:glycerol kinase